MNLVGWRVLHENESNRKGQALELGPKCEFQVIIVLVAHAEVDTVGVITTRIAQLSRPGDADASARPTRLLFDEAPAGQFKETRR